MQLATAIPMPNADRPKIIMCMTATTPNTWAKQVQREQQQKHSAHIGGLCSDEAHNAVIRQLAEQLEAKKMKAHHQ